MNIFMWPIAISIVFLVPATVAAKELSTSQSDVLQRYIKDIGAKGHIPPSSITAMAPDKESRENIGFVILFTHEDPEGVGGNTYEQVLTIFASSETNHKVLYSARVGGKLYRSMKLKKVSPASIDFSVLFYDSRDPACCPSVRGETSYSFFRGKFLEYGTRIFSIK